MKQNLTELPKQHKRDWLPLAAAVVLSLLYFAYSFKSKGFYQQDEANHYLSMLRFWYDPSAIMGNWAKPGYKILYVLTALGGQKLVIFQNCAFAAFSCFFAYKSAERLGAGNPWVAFILLASQPLWFSLSFRNYSEFPAAFLLVLAFWFYTGKKMLPAAIITGLICTMRQEFYPIAAIFGIWLLYRKHWLAAISIALLPLLQNLAGYLIYGDPLYLYNQILGTSATLKDAYERMGFDHYFLTSAVVFGPLALTFFVAYLAQAMLKTKAKIHILISIGFFFFLLNRLFNWKEVHSNPNENGLFNYKKYIDKVYYQLEEAYKSLNIIEHFETSGKILGVFALIFFIAYIILVILNRKNKEPALMIAALGFFLINCLFNWQEVHIGPATGGNLRYMCIISPLIAISGAFALDSLGEYSQRVKLLWIILPFLALVAIYMNYDHNYLKLLEDKPISLPITGAIFASVLLFLPLKAQWQSASLLILCGFFALLSLFNKSIELSPEDKVCKQVAGWYKQNEASLKGKPFYNTHIMFYYFLGKVEKQFQPEPQPIADTATMEKAPVGSLVLWESHYGFRPNYKRGVPYEYFAKSGKYEMIQIFEAEDQRFAYVIMKKTKP